MTVFMNIHTYGLYYKDVNNDILTPSQAKSSKVTEYSNDAMKDPKILESIYLFFIFVMV